MKKVDYEFCMSQFKPALVLLVILIVLVLAWSTWNCKDQKSIGRHGYILSTVNAAISPTVIPIRIKNKMTHAYWGNCNKCHTTMDIPSKPISKVFAGPPITVDAPQAHEYWGNCNMCHIVRGGLAQPKANKNFKAAAALGVPPSIMPNAVPHHPNWGNCRNCHVILSKKHAKGKGGTALAGFSRTTTLTLGLNVRGVTGDLMRKIGLANEDGALVTSVTLGSAATAAGIKKGDEIVRVNKIRVETLSDLDRALFDSKPGDVLKVTIYRCKQKRNLFVTVPPKEAKRAAAFNSARTEADKRFETQNTTPKGQTARLHNLPVVQPALTKVVFERNGRVAVAAMGPDLLSQTAARFGDNPYFIIYDTVGNKYRSMVNPNYTDTRGRGIQSAHFLADMEVPDVIAGAFSATSYDTLQTMHMNSYSGVSGRVDVVLSMYTKGTLRTLGAVVIKKKPSRVDLL